MGIDLNKILAGDVPDEVCQWIVEFHAEIDKADLTPLQAVRFAAMQITRGHSWLVTHVRSGLTYSVNLGSKEVIEIDTEAK